MLGKTIFGEKTLYVFKLREEHIALVNYVEPLVTYKVKKTILHS